MRKWIFVFMVYCMVLLGADCKSVIEDPDPIPSYTMGAPLIDREGNQYQTVIIGQRTWMAENFKGTRTSDNQVVQGIYRYENQASLADSYGHLYSWPAAQSVAPTGWHLPSAADWEALISQFGGRSAAGGHLKESGTNRWLSPNTGADNTSGFTAVAGGFRGSDGRFYARGEHGSYWGRTTDNLPLCMYLYHDAVHVTTESSPEDVSSGIAFAIRYVKD